MTMTKLEQLINKIDAASNNKIYGRICIDNEQAVLCDVDSNDVLLTLNDNHVIELVTTSGRYPVTKKEIETKKATDGDYLLFVGLNAFVRGDEND